MGSKADAEAAAIVSEIETPDVSMGDVSKFYKWICGNRLRLACHVSLVLCYWMICFLFIYYDEYCSVYPGSKIAYNVSKGGVSLPIFRYLICILVGLYLFYGAMYVWGKGTSVVAKRCGLWIAIPFAIVWFGVCGFLGTWQGWISYVITPLWQNSVLESACNGWDLSIMLAGTPSPNLDQSLPVLGIATVTLLGSITPASYYALQLEQSSADHNILYFYTYNTTNAEPPFGNITYNTYNSTYTINNVTAHYNTKPNLSFQKLDMTPADPSIPFIGSGPPSANLILKNGSRVFNTVTTLYSDCTQLEACAMLQPEGDFQIALGLVMIQQSQHAQTC